MSQLHATHRRFATLLTPVVLVLALPACGGDEADGAEASTPSGPSSVEAAQAAVSTEEAELAEAESAAAAAAADLCATSQTYVMAIDRYGDVLDATAPTVGDVTDAGSDLAAPAEDVQQAADEAEQSSSAVTAAEQELADAQAALAAALASADGTDPSPPSSSTPSPSPSEPSAGVRRVQEAEADFAAAQAGITPQTPLVEAAEQFNAAAVALEMAWLQLLVDSGCLTDTQQAAAADAVSSYTATLQQALADVGYYQAEVDGIYGPQTVEAVEALQEANDLPQTGTLDKATEAALRAELQARADAEAQVETASTAAVQQTLKLAGYWDGPVDGVWSDELTASLERLQTDLGAPVTGTVDAATIAAVEQAIATLGAVPAPSPPAVATPRPSTPAVATPRPTVSS